MILGIILAILILVVAGYLLYIIIDYNRIPDKKENKINNKATESATVPIDQQLTITSYNIGFGAYSQDFSFFMDGGKYSRAIDKKHVLDNIQGVIDTIKKEDVDFAYFQEVDTDSTRSYHVDQSEMISEAMDQSNMAFAVNYHSSYLFYPVTKPHGKSNSGIMTLSNYEIDSSVRRSLPVPTSFPDKFFDLDRCYSITKVKTDNGKYLCLINLHLSAYSKDDSIRERQVKMLSEDMQKEYDAGNYVICGGDFNHDMIGNSYEIFDNEKNDYKEEDLGFPDIKTIENALKLINLGEKGFVSMNELLLKMKKGFRKSLSEKIDKNHEGYISFPKFVKILRKIYGTDINLNYKLCAEYLYKVYIMSPEKVKSYLLQKSGQTNINIYLNKKEVYNNFMFAFCNDKFLFESFYSVYQEKKGKYKNKLNLNSFLLFIYSNNDELKSLERNLRFNSNNNKEKIDSTNNKLLIINILEKKITNVREIIEKINIKSSKLQKNCSISENYFNTLLKTHFNFNDDDSEKICDYFRLEEGKFDLKKFYEFDRNNERNRNIILQEDIILLCKWEACLVATAKFSFLISCIFWNLRSATVTLPPNCVFALLSAPSFLVVIVFFISQVSSFFSYSRIFLS